MERTSDELFNWRGRPAALECPGGLVRTPLSRLIGTCNVVSNCCGSAGGAGFRHTPALSTRSLYWLVVYANDQRRLRFGFGSPFAFRRKVRRLPTSHCLFKTRIIPKYLSDEE